MKVGDSFQLSSNKVIRTLIVKEVNLNNIPGTFLFYSNDPASGNELEILYQKETDRMQYRVYFKETGWQGWHECGIKAHKDVIKSIEDFAIEGILLGKKEV